MTQRENSLQTITNWLNFLRVQVDLRNALNLQDINVVAENFFRDFLNLLYGYNLKNANRDKQNTPAIDLFDDKEGIVIQVTSDNSSDKVHKTINGFNEGLLYNSYKRLIMLIITTKQEFPKTKFKNVGNQLFNKEHDIIDLTSLLKDTELSALWYKSIFD